MADMLGTIICVNLFHYTLTVNCFIGKCGITDILPWIIISIPLIKWKWPWQLLLSSILANGGVRKKMHHYSLYWINHFLKKAFANSSKLLAHKDNQFECIMLKWWRMSGFNLCARLVFTDFMVKLLDTFLPLLRPLEGVSDLWSRSGLSGAARSWLDVMSLVIAVINWTPACQFGEHIQH